jgi:hypothetical protein
MTSQQAQEIATKIVDDPAYDGYLRPPHKMALKAAIATALTETWSDGYDSGLGHGYSNGIAG